MSEDKKYITFRDLRAVAKTEPRPESNDKNTSTSIPSITSSSSIPSSASTSSSTSTTSTADINKPVEKARIEKPKKAPVAPERDFQRVPNSVTRRALPEGIFRGKSKQVWDYLWSISRGAVVPVRTVRKSRREIKSGSGLGSMVTVDAALEHLENVGLIRVKAVVGSLNGNEYEVFTPEETYAINTETYTSSTSTSSTTSPTQNLVHLDVLDSSISSTTQAVENTTTYRAPNTFIKTIENDDDEAFAGFVNLWRKVTVEVTGREPTKSESARWEELAEVLITELKIAAARTTVSSVPAFLSEHLRRRLWKKDKQELSEEGKAEGGAAKSGARNVDASRCPDCGGSGMYYPEGYEKGVAKCRHERLPAREDARQDST